MIIILFLANLVQLSTHTSPRYNKDINLTVDEIVCQLKEVQLVEARFGNRTHFLCLKQQTLDLSPVADDQITLLLEPEDNDDDKDFEEEEEEENDKGQEPKSFPINGYRMAYGFPLDDPTGGSAEGYIGDDNQFYGVLHLGNKTLHADPHGRDDLKKIFGAFEHNMETPRRRRDDRETDQMNELKQEQAYLPYQIVESKPPLGTARARICDLLLLADQMFYKLDANSSLNTVVQRMMLAVAQADVIFRNADFNEDGIPDNIGFSVKYILVLTSDDTDTRVFGNLHDKTTVDGKEYLMKFARLRRLSEVCLGVAFSGHSFQNRTLGLSFTSLGGSIGGSAGGLCDRRAYGRSFNTLAIAHATTADKDRVPERIARLTLAHEMGHSFGAHHDDNFPTPECRGHLMGSQSSTAENAPDLEFSVCSKRLIAATLSSMSYCFTEDDKPYCGNGIVEEGEACDCGLPSRCHFRDPCCTPRAGGALVFDTGTVHKNGCSVAPSAECHPSQGLCCRANCRLADLTHSGIDCKNLDQQCYCNNPASCRCGFGGRCMTDLSCHAAECALMGLKECQCLQSPGGAIGERGMCGICCEVEDAVGEPRCMGAEQAAIIVMEKGLMPDYWPGDDTKGPNVTVRVCNVSTCIWAPLRAWPSGSACVSRSYVGACSPRGVCGRMLTIPRSNPYPEPMRVQMQQRTDKPPSSSSSRIHTTDYVIFISILYCFVTIENKRFII